MNGEYEVQFDMKVKVDPLLRTQTSKEVFRAFMRRALPGHQKIVLETLQRTPAYLEMDPSVGYQPYVASQHVLNTPRGDIVVGVMSEMMYHEGKQSVWHTSVTTVEELLQRIAAKQDLPN